METENCFGNSGKVWKEGKNWKTFGNKLEICKTIWNSEKHWKFEEKLEIWKKQLEFVKSEIENR